MTARLTARGLRDYRALRRNGATADHAHAMAKRAETVRAFIAEHVGEETYTSKGTSYPVTLDGWTFRVTFEQDDIGRPEENGDCYDAEDIDAWERDRWTYYYVGVETVTPNASGSAGLGGVVAGDYWEPGCRLDTEGQLWADLLDHDLLGEAREQAERNVARALTGTLR
jgi:hypothetical protein